ncbi:MAG: serine--tRNA ligase [Flavobacteriales bacterium]|nr:serine--tRNA ligase [Flavobacteriales bacterium]|tara:strand:+ start:420 stop:1688 length:1269 start_codon:yes stop_codon:yes gene_type:complete
MLEINKIKNNTDNIVLHLKKRGIDVSDKLSSIIDLDNARIANQQKLDTLLAESNQIAQKIGAMAREKKFDEITPLKQRASEIKLISKDLIESGKKIEEKIKNILVEVPNVPHTSVPNGKTEKDNSLEGQWGDILESDKLLPHWELAEKYNIIDFKKGAEITGSGFPLYKGMGAQLQRGLINFFLDYNSSAGYKEYIPPYFVNEQSAFNTGQLPDKEGMMYHITNDDLYVIPTAEVPITNIFNNTKFQLHELPIKCTAYSPCFRREAGSYGKEVRGLNRLHQFDKVEIVQICEPQESYNTLNLMVSHVSELLKKLNITFRVVKLCAGDLGFTSALTYDFEVYAPGQKKWLEVSSVSNFETYQSNRLNLKYVSQNKKNILCHTLNGSALALPRIVVAILEQNQTDTGIIMPEPLLRYVNFDKIN